MTDTVHHFPTYFFYASIEGDVLICAGVSAICKTLHPSCTTVLLLPDHPRVKDKNFTALTKFDRIVHIPYFNTGVNFLKGIRGYLNAKRFLNELRLEEVRVCFMFNIYDVIDILVYSRLRMEKNGPAGPMVRISAFDIDFMNSTNIKLDFRHTLLASLYSVPICGKLLREYKVSGTESGGIRHFAAEWDSTMTIMRKEPSADAGPVSLQDLPYPPGIFVDDPIPAETLVPTLPGEDFILVLLDSFIPKNFTLDPTRFWTLVDDLLGHLVHATKYTVYVKGHPGMFDDIEKRITNTQVRFLDKELPAEDIYIRAHRQIKAVFGVVSTAMITASWMGLPVYDCAAYFGINGEWMERSRHFLSAAPSIVRFRSIEEIHYSQIALAEPTRRFSKDDSLITWKLALQTVGAIGNEA